MFELLPSRPGLHPAEALDGYLERLAEANGLSTATLHTLMREALGADTTALAFLMIKPQRAAIKAIADLGGADRPSLSAATLMRYGDGLPLHLEGLDPSRRHTYRNLVAQGWFPPHGSQACPLCLAGDGIWRLEWRLPLITVCRVHGVELLTECETCQQRFRMRRHSPMRPVISRDQLCGNPTGVRRYCDRTITAHRTLPAARGAVAAANTIALALEGQRIDMLGRVVDPRIFLLNCDTSRRCCSTFSPLQGIPWPRHGLHSCRLSPPRARPNCATPVGASARPEAPRCVDTFSPKPTPSWVSRRLLRREHALLLAGADLGGG